MEGVTSLQALLRWLIRMVSECVMGNSFRKPFAATVTFYRYRVERERMICKIARFYFSG